MNKGAKRVTQKKGRPTPKRKEVEVKPGASLAPAKTRAEKRARREELRQQRLAVRSAMARGEESALLPRDRGPVRRYVRNMVDARFSFGEYFLPLIFVVLLFSFTRNQTVALVSIMVMYVVLISAAIDGILFGRRVKKKVAEKFPNESTKGIAMYAFLRSTQMRRTRIPRPQVKRGQTDF